MSVFVNPFVSGRYPRLIGFGLWLAVALALLAAALWFSRAQLHSALRQEAKAQLLHFDKLNDHVRLAFDELARTATAPPCTSTFLLQLRRVAFLPDGLNEFMYAPLGMVTCSTSMPSVEPTLALGSLGAPDIDKQPQGGFTVWINKRLDAIGLPGVAGSVVHKEPFAIIIPPQKPGSDLSSWIKAETVISAPDGRLWHIGGEDGIFAAARAETSGSLSTLHEVVCGQSHATCVAVRADLAEIALRWRTELILAVALIAFYAIWPASVLRRRLKKYWSLAQRFRRNLNADSIVCAYQPILDLRTGQIAACEVLARWRDLDGSIVPPDRFIDLVAQSGQTLAFTRMVAERAFRELSEALPQETRLQINFNIFPRDLDSEKLGEAFRAFDGERVRFSLALEIVESDALGVDSAQGEIEALARRGIRTYIDDFGSGYSSIHRVASLAIHGVKLDRSFAMAPSESLMARMLVHAIEMVASSGREIVVEGVETRERLDLLIETGRVAHAQGYLISRPLPIERLAEFLARHDPAAVLARDARAAA